MRRKICRMGHFKLLPRNTHGTVGIYEDTYQVNYAINYCTLKLKLPSWSRWMDLHGNYLSNVWTTTSGNYWKQLNHTMFKQPWILTDQTNTRIVEICVDTYFIHIGSGIFWIGYVGREHAYHMMSTLKIYYKKITTD